VKPSFRTPVLAATVIFGAGFVPRVVRVVGRAVAHRAMAWLDARRERADRRDDG
jgi:hypothetical protein